MSAQLTTKELLALLDEGSEGLLFGLDDQRFRGAAMLPFAQPGVELHPNRGDSLLVPRGVWYRWVFEMSIGLLKIYVQQGHEEHELDFLKNGVVLIPLGAKGPASDDDDPERLTRGQCYATLATLNTMSALHSMRSPFVGQIASLIYDAVSWAFKRHVDDRYCASSPGSLYERALQVHTAFAEREQNDPETAKQQATEQEYRSLIDCWKQELAHQLSGITGFGVI